MKVYCIGLYDNSTQKYEYFPTFTFTEDATNDKNVKISQGTESITLEYSGPENLLNTSQIDIVKKGIIPSVTGTSIPNTDLQTFVDDITKNKKIPFAIFIEFYKNPNSPITGEYTAAQLMLMDGITKNPAKNQKGELICDIHNDVPLEKANLNNETNLNKINATAIKENGPDQSIKSLKPTILVALKQGAASMKQGMSSMFSNSPVQSSTTAQTTPICTFMKKVIENKKNPAPGPAGYTVVAMSTGASGPGGPAGGLVGGPVSTTNTGASGPVGVGASNSNSNPNPTQVNLNSGAGSANLSPPQIVAVSNVGADAGGGQPDPAKNISNSALSSVQNLKSLYDYIDNTVENPDIINKTKTITYDFTNKIIIKTDNNKQDNNKKFYGFYFPYSFNDINEVSNILSNEVMDLLNTKKLFTPFGKIDNDDKFVILFSYKNLQTDTAKKTEKLRELQTCLDKFIFERIEINIDKINSGDIVGVDKYTPTPENVKDCANKLIDIIKNIINLVNSNVIGFCRIMKYDQAVLNGYTVRSRTTKGGALKRIAQQTSIPRIYRPVSQRKTDYYNYT